MGAPREHGLLMKAPMVRATLKEIQAPGTGKSQTRRLLTKHNASFGSAPRLFWEHANFERAWVDGKGSGSEYLHVSCHRGDVAHLEALDETWTTRGGHRHRDQFPDCSPCAVCDRMGWPMTSHRLYPKWRPGERIVVRETWRSWNESCAGDHDDEACTEHCNQTYVAYKATPREGLRPRPDGKRITFLDASTPLEANRQLLGPWRPAIHMPREACRITGEILGVRIQRLQDISEADILAEGVTVDGVAEWTGTPWAEMPTLIDAFRVFWDSINPAHPWESNPWLAAISFRPEVANG
ncbi:MAG TPA: hypothetical protein VLT87_11235 [Thermoanaerobaculia bacterium]|nr:hypothetical protein [Thermoanaerobaculia bacterium]